MHFIHVGEVPLLEHYFILSKPAYKRLYVLYCAMYAKMQEGLYAWVSELESGKELTLVSGAPPSFLHCSRQGRLPGCLFRFDQMQVGQQCADGRTGKQCSYYCCYKLLSQTYVIIYYYNNLSLSLCLCALWVYVYVCANVYV